MSEDHEVVDRLLFAGEEVLARAGGGSASVVVTTHRLLAFTPDRDGATLRTVHRPNVDGVDREARGRRGLATVGAKTLVAGVVAMGVGKLVDFDALAASVPSPDGSVPGAGGILGMLGVVRAALAHADGVLVTFGGLLALGGIGALVAYWLTRRREVVVAVAGDDDLRLPADGFTAEELKRLEDALEHR